MKNKLDLNIYTPAKFTPSLPNMFSNTLNSMFGMMTNTPMDESFIILFWTLSIDLLSNFHAILWTIKTTNIRG